MFTLIKKYTREDISIPFFNEVHPQSEEIYTYTKTKYIETKKILKGTTEMSLDKKTQTATTIWKTSNDFLDFIVDNFVVGQSCISIHSKKQHIYNLKNNIKTETSCTEE